MFLETNRSNQEDGAGIEHIGGLYGYAMILTHNHAEAEDLVQDTYVRAIRAVERLREDSNVKVWLFTILRNVWLNRLRSRRTQPQLMEIDRDSDTSNLIAETSKNPYELYAIKTEHDQVREAIQELPSEFREIILLREYEELSYQEIASVLDCPVGTVMSRLGRARSKLRTALYQALPGATARQMTPSSLPDSSASL
jgi:RNA polymerase sigma-70 factor (ECF subfamily)